MRMTLRSVAATAAIALAAPAFAQQQQASTQGKVGIGLALPTNQFVTLLSPGNITTPLLFVPVNVTPNFRIEPHLGYFKVSDDANDTTNWAFSIGVGAFYVGAVTQQLQLYAGARVGFTRLVTEEVGGGGGITKREEWNSTLAPTFGAEYLPHPHFAIGAEGQLAFTSLGDVDETLPDGTTRTTAGGSAIATQGYFFMRVYFL